MYRGLLLSLMMPPFLYSWSENRAEIAESLDLLRAAIVRMPSGHPAAPELVNAALLIDRWLSRHPAMPAQKAFEDGPRSWNEDVAPKLIATWKRIEHLFPGWG